MARAYFLHQIKHKKDGTWDKGIVVKDGRPKPEPTPEPTPEPETEAANE